MTEFQAKAVVDAINAMFRGHHFNICTVDSCMKITGAIRSNDYEALRLYHCVNFDKMDRKTKEHVFRTTIELICNVDEFPAIKFVSPSEEIGQQLIESQRAETPRRVSFLKRLFGVE